MQLTDRTHYGGGATLIQEILRPRTLTDVIGCEEQIKLSRAYMDTLTGKSALLLQGQPGTGKTTIAHALAHSYNLQPIEVNASDERKKSSARDILSRVRSQTLDGKSKLLILDEADDPGAQDLLRLIINEPVRKILCCNYIDQIHWTVQKQCQHVLFEQPSTRDFVTLLEQMGIESSEELDTFRSYRDVFNWVMGGDARGPIILSELDQARALFSGQTLEKISVKFLRLMEYYVYNGGDPLVASHLDVLHRKNPKRAFFLLCQQPLTGLVNTPYKYYFPKESKRQRGPYLGPVIFRVNHGT